MLSWSRRYAQHVRYKIGSLPFEQHFIIENLLYRQHIWPDPGGWELIHPTEYTVRGIGTETWAMYFLLMTSDLVQNLKAAQLYYHI